MPAVKLFVIKNEHDFYFSEIGMENGRFIGAAWVSDIKDCCTFQSEALARSVIRTIRNLIEWEPVVADYDEEAAKAGAIATKKTAEEKSVTQFGETGKAAAEEFSRMISWNSSALMALLKRSGGRLVLTREEMAQLEEQRGTGALELVFKEEGDNIVVFLDT